MFTNGDKSCAGTSVGREQSSMHVAHWSYVDLDSFSHQCDAVFSEPPENLDSPPKYFRTFVDNEIIKNIVNQTNLYSVQKNGSSVNTTVQEIEVFLGITIMSSIIKLPALQMYWRNATRYPLIADVMGRSRSESFRKNLHFNDNNKMLSRDHPNYDKLFKIHPFLDSFHQNLAKLEPEEYHSTD